MNARQCASFTRETSMDARTTHISNLRKVSRYHLTMAFLAISIIAVAVTTIVGSTASTGATANAEAAQSVVLKAANETPNPEIDLDCENPILTVALAIDRSGSVYGNQTAYLNTVNQFIDDLYFAIVDGVEGGQVNIIFNAFASRSVNQNDRIPFGAGSLMKTQITDIASRDAMKAAVSRIHFRLSNDTIGNDYFAASNDSYDIARGYNPARQGDDYYAFTNWDDGLMDITRLASSPWYNNSQPGKHIDLALFLTDGSPNISNGSDRIFQVGDRANTYDEVNSWLYPAQTVSALRTGSPVSGTSARPPMAVKGVLIASSASQQMANAFGEGNYSTASNFGNDLKKELDEIVNNIVTDAECAKEVVTPSLQLSINPSSVTLTEDGGNRVVQIRVTNPSPVPITNVRVRVNGTLINTISSIAPNGGTSVISYVVGVDIGETLPGSIPITATGTASPTPNQVLASGNETESVSAPPATLSVTIIRLPLPA